MKFICENCFRMGLNQPQSCICMVIKEAVACNSVTLISVSIISCTTCNQRKLNNRNMCIMKYSWTAEHNICDLSIPIGLHISVLSQSQKQALRFLTGWRPIVLTRQYVSYREKTQTKYQKWLVWLIGSDSEVVHKNFVKSQILCAANDTIMLIL